MKKTLILFLLVLFSIFSFASTEKILMNDPNFQHNHNQTPIYPADQPDVYYDDVEQEIIIDGPGSEASYYDVDIVSMSTLDVMLSTQVNGTYDTIDVSSLPDDNYKIVITSSNFNEYEGYFTKVPGKNR